MTRLIYLAAAWLLWPAAALAQSDAAPDTETLLKRIEAQDKRIEALEQQLARQAQSVAAALTALGPAASAPPSSNSAALSVTAASGPPATPNGLVRMSPYGLLLESADGETMVRFRGNLAVDGRWYSDSATPVSADTFLLRKVRPYIDGTLDGIYDFRFQPDFGSGKAVILDAYLTARLAPWLALQAGKFKAPVGLERLQLEQYNRFLELGLPSDLIPNRDLGLQVGGVLDDGLLSYSIGAFDGAIDGNSTDANATPDADSNDGRKDVEGRLFLRPFLASTDARLRGLGFGTAATYAQEAGSAGTPLLPSYRTPGQQVFFSYRGGSSATYADGRRSRLVPQLYYYSGSFGMIGEYVDLRQQVSRQLTPGARRTAQLDDSAWQVSLSYFLTGERAAYNDYAPLSVFEPALTGWGAWELALRYHELRIDDAAFAGGAASFADPTASPRQARALGLGLNWYLNLNLKLMLNYERTRFDGGALAGNRPDENALLTRFSLVF